MFKIGEFSKLSRVPVKTLRYYHQIGLLEPAHVDTFTNYRFYTAVQLVPLNQILVLKELGFSLDEIRRLQSGPLSPIQLQSILEQKERELREQITTEQARLKRIQTRLQQLTQENSMTQYDVVIKNIDTLRVASIRDTIASYTSAGPLYETLFATLGQHQIAPMGAPMAIYHDKDYKEKDVDVEAAVPIHGGALPENSPVKIRDLPGAQVAAVVRQGAWDDFTPIYQALMQWIANNGYRITGPNREIYLQGSESNVPPEEYIVEIQFPVEKAS